VGERYELSEATWAEVGRQGARLVESHVLVPREEGGRTRVSVTRIAPDGAFGPHVDDYGHVFCVLDGRGEAKSGGERTPLAPGTILRIEAGEPHAVWAAPGGGPLLLLTMNLYPDDQIGAAS
jgi:quercetin dioxygenase-like cupin family protein